MMGEVFLRVDEGLDLDYFGLEAGIEQVELVYDGVATGVMRGWLNAGYSRVAVLELHLRIIRMERRVGTGRDRKNG